MPSASVITGPALSKAWTLDGLKDLTPISQASFQAYVLAVHPAVAGEREQLHQLLLLLQLDLHPHMGLHLHRHADGRALFPRDRPVRARPSERSPPSFTARAQRTTGGTRNSMTRLPMTQTVEPSPPRAALPAPDWSPHHLVRPRLFDLLDNATRFSPPNTVVVADGRRIVSCIRRSRPHLPPVRPPCWTTGRRRGPARAGWRCCSGPPPRMTSPLPRSGKRSWRR